MSATISLTDIPDFSSVLGGSSAGSSGDNKFENGWYEGVILETRSFTDKNGNDRVFESGDAPSANGESRNIKLQVQVKRQSDGKELNTSWLVNYRPEDLTQETVRAIVAKREQAKAEGTNRPEWGDLFRAAMAIERLAKLQQVAGVRQFSGDPNGGFDLKPLFGKKAYFKLKDDDRNPQYKAIADIRLDKPTRVPVL